MSWTTANMELDGNRAQVRSTDMNEFTVRVGILSYKSTTVGYKYRSDCYIIFSLFPPPLSLWGVSYII